MTRVFGALLYLRVNTVRNAVMSRIARLKQPKYLVGAMIGVAYLYFAFFRRLQMGRTWQGRGGMQDLSPDVIPMVLALGGLALLIYFALCWVWPRERASLAFTESEIAFLFPAPVSRRALVHLRLISMTLRLLFTALVLAVVSVGWSFLQGDALVRVIGWWILFATISLHIVGSSFAITRLLDSGINSARRQLIASVCILAGITAVFALSWSSWRGPTSADLADFSSIAAYITQTVHAGAIGYLLLPFEWMLKPLLAGDKLSMVTALVPALGIFALHYVWVLFSEASFEEASVAKAQKRAERIAAMRAGNFRLGRSAPKARRTPFKLDNAPRVEFAFLWKNLLATASYLRPRVAILTAIAIVVVCKVLVAMELQVFLYMIGAVSSVMIFYVLLFGPMIARQDLRNDLLNIDILKTYPLQGWQIVLGEILTPTAVISVLIWLLLLASALAFEPRNMAWLTPSVRFWGAMALGCVAPFLCAVQVLILNTGTLLFPAWTQASRGRAQGIDVMGQRILFLVALLLAIVCALVPAGLIAGVVYAAVYFAIGGVLPMVLAFLALLAVLGVEIGLGVYWLGGRFEKFDLSAELRP